MGWATDNLSASERKGIAEGLIVQGGGKVTQHDQGRGELVGLCPLHQESNPSFGYNYAKDVYNCSSGCGGGDLIRLFAAVNGLDNKSGFKRFKINYGTDDGAGGERRSSAKPGQARGKKSEPKEPDKIISEAVWQALEALPETWVRKLMQDRAWSSGTIRRLDLRLWRAPKGEAREKAKADKLYLGRKGEKRIALPVHDEKGRLVNIRLYLPDAQEKKVVSWGRGYGSARLWPGEGA